MRNIKDTNSFFLLLLASSALVDTVHSFGDVLNQPFRAETRVRQLCLDEAMVGCGPEDDGRRILQEGNQRFISFSETIEGGGAPPLATTTLVDPGSSGGGGSQPNLQAPPPNDGFSGDFTQYWSRNGTIQENGETYDRYTIVLDTVVNNMPEAALQKSWMESGLVGDFAEYLETRDGTPYVLRLYSLRNNNLLYSERIFDSIEGLPDQQQLPTNANSAPNLLGPGGRRKLHTKNKDPADEQPADEQPAPADLTLATTSRTRSAAKLQERRNLDKIIKGLSVPRGCYAQPNSRFCLAVVASKDLIKGTTTLGLKLAISSLSDVARASLWTRVKLGNYGELLFVQALAEGCARPVKFSIGGLGNTGVEICFDGYVDFVPLLSWDADMRLQAGIDFDIKVVGKKRIDLAGGGFNVNTKTLPGERILRFESLKAFAFSETRIFVITFGASVSVEVAPLDIGNIDNWYTNIYFEPFVGIDLFFWREVWRPRFRCVVLGPVFFEESYEPVIDFPEAFDPVTCGPQDFLESTGHHYVSFQLPGDAYVGEIITFEAGKYSIDHGGKCSDIAWGVLEFICGRDGSWKQIGGSAITTAQTWPVNGQCVSFGIDQEYVKYGVIAPCKSLHLQIENRVKKVEFSYPPGEKIGSIVTFTKGRAAYPYDDWCYEIAWDALVFKCNTNGDWDLIEGQVRRANYDVLAQGKPPCEIDYEPSPHIYIHHKVVTEPTPPPALPPPKATCSANSLCKGLEGNCCPTNAGVDLFCCGTTSGSCSANKRCSHLDGDCCPTSDGVYLDCCEKGFGSCAAHPSCSHLQGDCCPTPSGKFLSCCMDDKTVQPMEWPQHPQIAKCHANAGCAGLDGDCCPTKDGIFLYCCGNYEPKCAAHSACKDYSGDCCPTKDGIMKSCCNKDFAYAQAHPGCAGDDMKCPDPYGKIHECCLNDPATAKVSFERIAEPAESSAWSIFVWGLASLCLIFVW